MPPEQKDWKKLQMLEGRGGRAYIPLEELRELEDADVLTLDKKVEYSISTGVSDGRGRMFMQLRNAPEEEENDD